MTIFDSNGYGIVASDTMVMCNIESGKKYTIKVRFKGILLIGSKTVLLSITQ